jgi:hypothetical protein
MSVDLNDLIPSLQRELSPPGSNLYPNATDDDWLGHLQDAFWEARIQGLLSGFTLDDQDDALIVPQSGTTDMTRDLQQLIVLFAGYRVTLTQFQNINSGFRAKAGPAEFEQQKSAQTLKAVLDAIKERLALIVSTLPVSASRGPQIAAFEGYLERTYDIAVGYQWWIR